MGYPRSVTAPPVKEWTSHQLKKLAAAMYPDIEMPTLGQRGANIFDLIREAEERERGQ